MLARALAAFLPVLLAWSVAGAADPLVSARLNLRQTVQCCYREGSISYFVVRQVGSDRDSTRATRILAPLEPTLVLGAELTPGRYKIASFQRPCDGNCDFLNPPIDQCTSEPLDLRAGMVLNVLVSVVPFGGCVITEETGSI